MADPARFMEASVEALGWEKGTFIGLLNDNRDAANEIVIESNPFATTLIAFLQDHDGVWRGTTSDLLQLLTDKTPDKARHLQM